MDRWRNKVAIVTGASSGIGAATAKLLTEYGVKVVGLARRVEKISEIAKQVEAKGGKLYAQKADMTQEDDIMRAFKWVEENIGPIHVLINNAGVARPTNIINGDTDEWKKVLDTNVLGVTIASREAIRSMMDNNVDGHIININSVAGHYVPQLPLKNVYPASKYAVTALTETLRQELIEAGYSIKVTSLSPGYVETEIAEINGFLQYPNIANVEKVAPRLYASDIANAIVYVLSTPPHVQITELTIRPIGEPI